MLQALQIHKKDNVAIAFSSLEKGKEIEVNGQLFILLQNLPAGHKFALQTIKNGEEIIKYGFPIGHATGDIFPGEWVHTHNIATNLSEQEAYVYTPCPTPLAPVKPETFMGYLRADSRAGVRNEIWIIPTVGCVNEVAKSLALAHSYLADETNIDGVYAFPHPYGCSQMGDDHEMTKKLLAALVTHPNAGGILVIGLGCENNTMAEFQKAVGSVETNRIQFMVCQEEDDELETGRKLLIELAKQAGQCQRQPIPISSLVVGLKCGGSDGLSGITANPVVGAFSDLLIARGGSTVLSEVPEMFGAEQILLNRSINKQVFDDAVNMIEQFKRYFTDHGQVVYENPSPGNKQGGISTLEDKSLGCVQKGGSAPISDVIGYACPLQKQGLTLMSGPGNDLVAATALAATGAQIVLFTTGRGTPFGAPVPTVKISSNSTLFHKKKNWIDFNAGTVVEGETVAQAATNLLHLLISLANGKQAKNEQLGYREIAIFKNGVTL